MILGLRTAIYPVTDLASAKSWYSQVLGVQPYFDQPFYVGFSVGGFELGLLPDETSGTTGPQILWGVLDVETELERLLALGATELVPVQDVGEGIKVAAVKDPFGNRLGIIENPNFSASDVR
jgi:predicted enzyme related to lactoylglutathione lyase